MTTLLTPSGDELESVWIAECSELHTRAFYISGYQCKRTQPGMHKLVEMVDQCPICQAILEAVRNVDDVVKTAGGP